MIPYLQAEIFILKYQSCLPVKSANCPTGWSYVAKYVYQVTSCSNPLGLGVYSTMPICSKTLMDKKTNIISENCKQLSTFCARQERAGHNVHVVDTPLCGCNAMCSHSQNVFNKISEDSQQFVINADTQQIIFSKAIMNFQLYKEG